MKTTQIQPAIFQQDLSPVNMERIIASINRNVYQMNSCLEAGILSTTCVQIQHPSPLEPVIILLRIYNAAFCEYSWRWLFRLFILVLFTFMKRFNFIWYLKWFFMMGSPILVVARGRVAPKWLQLYPTGPEAAASLHRVRKGKGKSQGKEMQNMTSSNDSPEIWTCALVLLLLRLQPTGMGIGFSSRV